MCTEKTKHEGTDGISHEDFTSPYLCVRARVFVRVCVLFDGYLLLAQIKLCGWGEKEEKFVVWAKQKSLKFRDVKKKIVWQKETNMSLPVFLSSSGPNQMMVLCQKRIACI